MRSGQEAARRFHEEPERSSDFLCLPDLEDFLFKKRKKKKRHFPHLQCSRAKYHQIQFGGAKPDDLHDSLSLSTKAHFQAFTMLPYAK